MLVSGECQELPLKWRPLKVIFPHHRPLDRDRKHFERAVCRCQKAREKTIDRRFFFRRNADIETLWFKKILDVSKSRGGPLKSSLLIGFSIIFTIHFGGENPQFLVQHPYLGRRVDILEKKHCLDLCRS